MESSSPTHMPWKTFTEDLEFRLGGVALIDHRKYPIPVEYCDYDGEDLQFGFDLDGPLCTIDDWSL